MLGIHNLHHKKALFSYTILFPDVPTFPDIMKVFLISVTRFRNTEIYLKCNRKATSFKVFVTFSVRVLF